MEKSEYEEIMILLKHNRRIIGELGEVSKRLAEMAKKYEQTKLNDFIKEVTK